MAKQKDIDRVLALLSETEGLSSRRIKLELNLSDERYDIVRETLLDGGQVEKYVCRGGGLRLSKVGEAQVNVSQDYQSSVSKEYDLYTPFKNYLDAQNAADEINSVVIGTHNLRSKGKWQNPDITEVQISYYRYLFKTEIAVVTYELKQYPNWDVRTVFEAASHHRFAHEAHVVLEWPNTAQFSLTDASHRMEQMARECRRFGVGLATLHKHYSGFRLHQRLEARPHVPSPQDANAWLDYTFSRLPASRQEFEKRIKGASL